MIKPPAQSSVHLLAQETVTILSFVPARGKMQEKSPIALGKVLSLGEGTRLFPFALGARIVCPICLLCNSFAKGVFHFPDKKDTHDVRLCYCGKKARMDAWTAIGFFLLGAAVGALLTRIASLGEIRRVKAEMERRERDANRPAA